MTKKLVEVVLADDLHELLLGVRLFLDFLFLRVSGLAERLADFRRVPPFLRAVSFINKECHPPFRKRWIEFDAIEQPREFLLRRHDDRFPIFEETDHLALIHI